MGCVTVGIELQSQKPTHRINSIFGEFLTVINVSDKQQHTANLLKAFVANRPKRNHRNSL